MGTHYSGWGGAPLPSIRLDMSSIIDSMENVIRINKHPAALNEAMQAALGDQALIVTGAKEPLLAQLEFLRDMERNLAGQLPQTVARLRECGASWQEIGNAMGVSRQAAQQRWGGEV